MLHAATLSESRRKGADGRSGWSNVDKSVSLLSLREGKVES